MQAGLSPHLPLRVDAQRNRERILIAARQAFIERGADVPLEDIAAGAGVGIATLYRRFPDRQALQRAVAFDALSQASAELHVAIDEESTAFHALVRYMRRALAMQVSAVVPVLLGSVELDRDEFLELRTESAQQMQQLIDRAIAEGALRAGISFGDIAMLLVRLSRPLPGAIDREIDLQMAQRHLEIAIDGLRAVHETAPLPGVGLNLEALRALPGESSAPDRR